MTRALRYRLALRITRLVAVLLAAALYTAGAWCGWHAQQLRAQLAEAQQPISRARLVEDLRACGQQLADARRVTAKKVEVARR